MTDQRTPRFFSGLSLRPAAQFLRYLVCGGIGAGIELLLFAWLAWKVFPALREDEWAVRWFNLSVAPVPPERRALNFALCMTITFIVSNLAVYALNARWVFQPGRHSRRREILLFYGFALLSYAVGTAAGSSLIARFAVTGTVAYAALSAVSILLNYAARKFIVFKG